MQLWNELPILNLMIDLPGIINWLMLTHKSLQHATLATLRPGGGFEITSYSYLIKFLAKGHSSPLSL